MSEKEVANISVGEQGMAQIQEAAILNGQSVEETIKLAFALAWRYGEVYSRGGKVLWEDEAGKLDELTIGEDVWPEDFYRTKKNS